MPMKKVKTEFIGTEDERWLSNYKFHNQPERNAPKETIPTCAFNKLFLKDELMYIPCLKESKALWIR